MFERYTEAARRVIFFARYEASQFGCDYIEVEHLLLGLVRESRSLRNLPGASELRYEEIRSEVEKTPTMIDAMAAKKNVPTSTDLPLSNEATRVLSYAVEEAERLSSRDIGSEHLLLGLMREPTVAAEILQRHGCLASTIREAVGSQWRQSTGAQGFNVPDPHAVPRIYFIDDDKNERVDDLALFAFFPIPRVGETVVLSVRTEPTPFRVVEVSYDFTGAKPRGVWVRVARKQTQERSAAPTDST